MIKGNINNNFIIASRAYFLQSPTCTRVNNLDYIVMILTPMESWCRSCFARGRGLVNGSVTFRSVCILQISMSHVDATTTLCLELLQLTAPVFKINTYRVET